MGLCKCPQRKVTNIFCYEHRVNVCEHCLMQNHPKCVVDTYRNWITDSLYSPKCGLCEEDLNSNETVRLLCLHIVHWDCLDAWARSLPPTTAPAGYTCPICRKMCVFPSVNQASPISDSLRAKMTEVNWARVGLGLPLLDTDANPPKEVILNGLKNNANHLTPNSHYRDGDFDKKSDVSESDASFDGRIAPRNTGAEIHNNSYQFNSPKSANLNNSYSKLSESYGAHSNSYYSDGSATGGASLSNPNPRKSVKFDLETPLMIDEDDNKYRRRSPFESLSRWLKQINPSNKRRTRRRTALYVILSIIGMLILLMFLFGRGEDGDDDAFDPRAHPNILVGEGKNPLGHEFDS